MLIDLIRSEPVYWKKWVLNMNASPIRSFPLQRSKYFSIYILLKDSVRFLEQKVELFIDFYLYNSKSFLPRQLEIMNILFQSFLRNAMNRSTKDFFQYSIMKFPLQSYLRAVRTYFLASYGRYASFAIPIYYFYSNSILIANSRKPIN